MTDVIVVGGGPTGLMLAGELRLHGVQVLVLEKLAEPTPIVRSLGLHARPRGAGSARHAGAVRRARQVVSGRQFLRRDQQAGAGPAGTAHPYVLSLPQTITDRLLAEHAAEVGVEIRRGCELAELDAPSMSRRSDRPI